MGVRNWLLAFAAKLNPAVHEVYAIDAVGVNRRVTASNASSGEGGSVSSCWSGQQNSCVVSPSLFTLCMTNETTRVVFLPATLHHGEHLSNHGDRRGTDEYRKDAWEDEQD